MDQQSLPPYHLRGPIRSAARTLRVRFEDIQRQHRGEQGNQREDDLREFLARLLPKRFALSKGEIVAAEGSESRSPAMDIIIYDALNTPLLDKTDSTAVVPTEGVYAVVEVASRLDNPKLREDAEKIRRAKALEKTAFALPQTVHTLGGPVKPTPWPTIGAIFAYESINLGNLKKTLVELDNETAPEHRVDFICSLSTGCIVNYGGLRFNADDQPHRDDSLSGFSVEIPDVPIGTEGEALLTTFSASWTTRLDMAMDPSRVPGGALAWFYLFLSKPLAAASMAHIDPQPYIGFP
jgi:hypothetical protein